MVEEGSDVGFLMVFRKATGRRLPEESSDGGLGVEDGGVPDERVAPPPSAAHLKLVGATVRR